MIWKVTTEPTEEPVSLAELKLHIRGIDDTIEDALITSLGVTARKYIEDLTDQFLVTQTVKIYCDRFPFLSETLVLPVFPIQSITAIKYIASDTIDLTYSTWATTKWNKDLVSREARILPRHGESYPTTQNELNAVEIELVVGYGLAEDVPDHFKDAIELIVAELYEHRQNRVQQLPTTVMDLLKREMNFRFV